MSKPMTFRRAMRIIRETQRNTRTSCDLPKLIPPDADSFLFASGLQIRNRPDCMDGILCGIYAVYDTATYRIRAKV